MGSRGRWAASAVLLLTALLLLLPHAAGSGSGDFPPPAEGTWRITKETRLSGESLTLRGDLIVEDGGRLVLVDTTIRINCSVPNEFRVVVKPGGALDMVGSSIEPLNASAGFRMEVESAPRSDGWPLDPVSSFVIGIMAGIGIGFPLGIAATAYAYRRWFSRNLPPPV